MDVLPTFDLGSLQHLAPTDEQRQACNAIARCLQDTGCLIVRDPRVSCTDNDVFLDCLERYFGQDDQLKAPDVREELCYQVGLTPEGIEKPRLLCVSGKAATVSVNHRGGAIQQCHSRFDVKCRFMWRVGPRPSSTHFPELNADPVIPQNFPNWAEIMDGFGGRLLSVGHTVARCVALGLGLAPDSLTQAMEGGPHLLAPTGSDLGRHGKLGQVLAGYHSDLNLLTVHGKSRFPGLFVWLADGTKIPVRVPPGCLLVQAGQQLEWLTGGSIKAGRHEVVVTPDTQAAVSAAQQAGRSTWRVSSTLFVHVASDYQLKPLGHFADVQGAKEQFPPTPAGEQVQKELETISLRRTNGHPTSTTHHATTPCNTPSADSCPGLAPTHLGQNLGHQVADEHQVQATVALQGQRLCGSGGLDKPVSSPSLVAQVHVPLI